MDESCAKLRENLIIIEQNYSDRKHSVIKDPISRKIFRVQEIESIILKYFDGNHTPSDIQQVMLEQYDIDVPTNVIESFINELKSLSLINGGELDYLSKKKHNFFRLNPFFIRLFSFNPDSFFNLTINKLKFLFSTPFMLIYVTILISALFISVIYWNELFDQVNSIFTSKFFSTVENILLIYSIFFITSFFHELFHGLTCKFFGREVSEMGFALFFFIPTFFSNTTETWLLKERSKRLWVSFAGILTELVICGFAIIIWAFTSKGSYINLIFFLIMIISGLKFLFNLIPLIKLDGYFALCEYLDIPNLRKKSFQYLLSLFLTKYKRDGISKREKIIYISYGIPAIIFTVLFITYIYLFSYKIYHLIGN